MESSRLDMDYIAAAQKPPSNVSLRIGISGQAADPNTDTCAIVWHQHSLKPLACYGPLSPAVDLKRNLQPSKPLVWNYVRKGKFLYFELTIAGVGGDAIFSRVTADAEQYEIKRY